MHRPPQVSHFFLLAAQKVKQRSARINHLEKPGLLNVGLGGICVGGPCGIALAGQ